MWLLHMTLLCTEYTCELSLVLNGTMAIPDLDSLEKQAFQSFRDPTNTSLTLSSSTTISPSPGLTPSSTPQTRPPSTQPKSTPRTHITPSSSSSSSSRKRSWRKTNYNYLLLDPRFLDIKLMADSASSGTIFELPM